MKRKSLGSLLASLGCVAAIPSCSYSVARESRDYSYHEWLRRPQALELLRCCGAAADIYHRIVDATEEELADGAVLDALFEQVQQMRDSYRRFQSYGFDVPWIGSYDAQSDTWRFDRVSFVTHGYNVIVECNLQSRDSTFGRRLGDESSNIDVSLQTPRGKRIASWTIQRVTPEDPDGSAFGVGFSSPFKSMLKGRTWADKRWIGACARGLRRL